MLSNKQNVKGGRKPAKPEVSTEWLRSEVHYDTSVLYNT